MESKFIVCLLCQHASNLNTNGELWYSSKFCLDRFLLFILVRHHVMFKVRLFTYEQSAGSSIWGLFLDIVIENIWRLDDKRLTFPCQHCQPILCIWASFIGMTMMLRAGAADKKFLNWHLLSDIEWSQHKWNDTNLNMEYLQGPISTVTDLLDC